MTRARSSMGASYYMHNERCRQVKRQWSILQFLAAQRYATFDLIAAHFECSIKTIRRDLDALQSVGFPIYFVTNADSGGKFVRLDRDWLNLQGVSK